MGEKNTQSRKWQITINNPQEKGYDHDKIKSILETFKSCVYWVMSDEVGEQGTYHTHFFLYCSSAVRFSTLQNKFTGAHFEMARGTCEENRNYIYKLGKWEKTNKKETNLEETHEENGQMPVERQGQRNDINDLYDMIKSGMTDFEIIEDNPNYMTRLEKIERTRQIVREEKFKNTWRELDVYYVYGRTGTGKTRSVMDAFGYDKVYRITDYDHPFDGYDSQDVIIFEEFRSSLKIQDMLNYLDGYPLTLPCRYNNKVACYTKVYIITNIAFNEQFKSVQENHPETWLAFCRRINENGIICMNPEGDDPLVGFSENKDDEMINLIDWDNQQKEKQLKF